MGAVVGIGPRGARYTWGAGRELAVLLMLVWALSRVGGTGCRCIRISRGAQGSHCERRSW